jgi:LPS export ABC transporter protein LptC
MRKKIPFRFLVGMIVLGSLGVVAITLWMALSPGPEGNIPPQKPDSTADLKLDRVHYMETRDGVKEWELEAASVAYYKDENTVVLEKIQATFFGKDKDNYVLVGAKGRLNTQTKAIEIYDGVKVDSTNGYHMRTQSLTYQADRRELTTSDPVEMRGPDLQVEGGGMVVELTSQRLKILGGVKTTISLPAIKKLSPSTM